MSAGWLMQNLWGEIQWQGGSYVFCIFPVFLSLQLKSIQARVPWATQVQRILRILRIASPAFRSMQRSSCQYSPTCICTSGSSRYTVWALHMCAFPAAPLAAALCAPCHKAMGLAWAGATGRLHAHEPHSWQPLEAMEWRRTAIPFCFPLEWRNSACSVMHCHHSRAPSPIGQGRGLTWGQMHLTEVSLLSKPLLLLC